MAVMRRILGAYAMLTAAAVAVHFVVTPLYDDGSTGFPVWKVFNWFMAPAVVLALATGAIGKFRLDRDEGGVGDAVRALEANVLFYASAVLALWFFWNWFGDLTSREEASMWAFIDPLFVLVVGACGRRLWREA